MAPLPVPDPLVGRRLPRPLQGRHQHGQGGHSLPKVSFPKAYSVNLNPGDAVQEDDYCCHIDGVEWLSLMVVWRFTVILSIRTVIGA